MSAEILAALKRIEAKVDALAANRGGAAPGELPPATDEQLDGQYGDPTVKFKPRAWHDGDFKGHHYSECPPAFLDEYANALNEFAAKNAATDPKKAGYERLDSSRARGWARRIRAGWKPAQPSSTGSNYDFDDGNNSNSEIPF